MSSFYDVILNDEEEDLQSRKNIDKWIFRLLLLLLGVMPLIVLANVEEVISPLISNVDVLSSGTKGDLFTHYKALFLLVITIIVSGMFLTKIFFMSGTVKKTFLNYVLGAFVIAIVVSTILSPNITTALSGQYNRSDGAISWLCYVALMFIAMNIEYPKNVVRYIMYAMIPFVYINLIIITMNFYGKDLLQHTWMQKLVSITLPEGAGLSEGSTLLGTLNHGNYMSGMFAIMTVMYFVWAIVEKQIGNKIMGLVTAIASILVVLMSISTSGFLTVVCIMPFLIWIVFKSEKKSMSFALLGAYVVIAGISLHMFAQENSKVWDESVGFFVSSNPYVEEVPQPTSYLNNEENMLATLFDNKAYASDQAVELPVIPETGVGAGSGRVYIWTYMLDLVKERPLFGYGLDSLMYNFQHYNIDARANLETESVIVDKPHNMYMGILYGTGIIGFIAFIVLIFTITWASLKQVFKKQDNVVATVLAVGVLAFLFQGIFNDTLPGIGGVMWVLVGMFLFGYVKQDDIEKI